MPVPKKIQTAFRNAMKTHSRDTVVSLLTRIFREAPKISIIFTLLYQIEHRQGQITTEEHEAIKALYERIKQIGKRNDPYYDYSDLTDEPYVWYDRRNGMKTIEGVGVFYI